MRSSRAVLVLIASLVWAAPAELRAQAESESWYVERGRANMEIGNYRAAIEAYEKATELNPKNREAMRSLGLAYEHQGLTTKAIEQFDRYLAQFTDDPEIAFKQADYLDWSRYAYRRMDAIRYYRMGLSHQEDLQRRYALARLLAQERAQLDEALEEYHVLLAAEPDNAQWRAQYRELLLWEERHLSEAVSEYRRLEEERPDEFDVRHKLAQLIARENPRGSEAVDRYAALVAERPRDPALRLEYAEVLTRNPRRRRQAVDEYRQLLAQRPTPATREAYADLLSGEKSNRSEALKQYEVLLRENSEDAGVRLKYARLLGSDRDDVERAIAEYEVLIAQTPRNAEAHQGLAEAYAWLGDSDRALQQSNLAVRHGATGSDVYGLRLQLLRGREPRVAPLLRGLVQRGESKSKLSGVATGIEGRTDLSPFVTVRAEGGVERYWRGSDDTMGAFGRVDVELRLDPERRIEFGLGYHGLGDDSEDNYEASVAYQKSSEDRTLRIGFDRTLRYDSYVALAGDKVAGTKIGSARENRFFGRLERDRGRAELGLELYGGWVDAQSVSDNPFFGARGRVAFALAEADRYDLRAVYALDLYHYDEDAFGVTPSPGEPRPGGYFSPDLFFEQVPGLALRYRWEKDRYLDLEGGVALQYVDESMDSDWNVGGHGRLRFVMFREDSRFWTFESGYTQIRDAYARFDARVSLTFKF